MTPIRFTPDLSVSPMVGTLVYNRSDLSFDFEMAEPRPAGLYSLSIDTLQLEVGVDSERVLYPWGYWPSGGWSHGRVNLPEDPVAAAVKVELLEGLPPHGASVALTGGSVVKTIFDEKSGWIELTFKTSVATGLTAVEFASNCIMQISNDQLVGLLLRPEAR